MEFNERYRLDGQTVPAWLCDNALCGYQELVRAQITRTVELGKLVESRARVAKHKTR